MVVRKAADGYDGPVIAIEDADRSTLQVQLPETTSAAPQRSSGGAQ
jgi:hypothetical protein